MKRFIKKFFGEKSSNKENQDELNSSVIEEAVVVLLLRAANIDGKKDEQEIGAEFDAELGTELEDNPLD